MINQNNTIIHHNTKKHQKSVLGIAVHGDLKSIETERDADESKEDAEHNGKRMDIGFKERSHDNVNENQRENHRLKILIPFGIHRLEAAVHLIRISLGQGHAFHARFHNLPHAEHCFLLCIGKHC